MSHDTHSSTPTGKDHTRVSFSSSFWLVIILVFLFISALNFVQVMKGGHEGHEAHHEGAATEQMHEGIAPAHHEESAEPAGEKKEEFNDKQTTPNAEHEATPPHR